MECINSHIFNKWVLNQTDSTAEIIYNTQASKINIKISAFQFNPVRFSKAYVNQFIELPNAMYSHSVYLYGMSKR